MTYYKTRAATSGDDISIRHFVAMLKSPAGSAQASSVAKVRSAGTKDAADKHKSRLPAVTLSGTFEGPHKKDALRVYSGLLQLDFDKVSDGSPEGVGRLASLRAQLVADPHTLIVFLSPSGEGVKGVCRVDASSGEHGLAFESARLHYLELTGLEIDTKASDISRLCYLSNDEDAYFNPGAIPLKKRSVNVQNAVFERSQIAQPKVLEATSPEETMNWCCEQVQKGQGFYNQGTPGNRNNFANNLAVMAKKYGVPEPDAAYYIGGLEPEGQQRKQNLAVVANVYKNDNLPFAKEEHKGKKASKVRGASSKAVAVMKEVGDVAEATSESKKEIEQSGEAYTKPPQSSFALIEGYLKKKYDFRFNVIRQEAERRLKTKSHSGVNEWDTVSMADIFVELSRLGYKGVSQATLEMLFKSSDIPRHNPIQAYFEQLPPWKVGDTDWVATLFSFLKLENEADRPRLIAQGTKWFVRSVSTALKKGEANKQIFTLSGELQHMGKTTFLRFFCPQALLGYFSENITFDKDGEITFSENFLGNLDELPQLKADMERLKQVTSKDRIKVRAPYERKQVEAKRIINLVASTNKTEFLNDETGSVRWLVFGLVGIDFGYTQAAPIDNVWAQAYSLFKNGFRYDMTREEQEENERANRGRFVQTNEYLLLATMVPVPKPEMTEKDMVFMTTTTVEAYLLQKNAGMRISGLAVGKAMRQIGYPRVKKRLNGASVWCYGVAATDQIKNFIAINLTTLPQESLEY